MKIDSLVYNFLAGAGFSAAIALITITEQDRRIHVLQAQLAESQRKRVILGKAVRVMLPMLDREQITTLNETLKYDIEFDKIVGKI